MNSTTTDLDFDNVTPPPRWSKIGILTQAGGMEKVVITATIREMGELLNTQKLLSRTDYDIESSKAGNRDISEVHAKSIEHYIKTAKDPYLGMLVLAMPREDANIVPLKRISEGAELVEFQMKEDAENPFILDGQHRNRGAVRAWQSVKDLDMETATEEERALRARLENTSVGVEILFESNRDVVSTIFVNMGTTKAISKDLVAVMDTSKIQNRLGKDVTTKCDLLRHRTTYLGRAAATRLAKKHGRELEPLYTAGAIVDASAIIAGVGVRDRSPQQREDLLDKIVQEKRRVRGLSTTDAIDEVGTQVSNYLNYAYDKLPGWSDIKNNKMPVEVFKDTYVHGTAAGLKVIAIVLATAKAAGVSPERTIDAMAKVVPWRRDALRAGLVDDREGMVHEFFQGTLVNTVQDEESGKWKAVTAGARRDLYQAAADKVLKAVAAADTSLDAIKGISAYQAIGLAPQANTGRPKKKAPDA